MADTKTLYDEVKGIEIIGARLSGEPEVVHEIEDWWRANKEYPIIRDEIVVILQNCPNPFPMNFRAPQNAQGLTPHQFKVMEEIFFINPLTRVFCTPDLYSDVIQVVIWQAAAIFHSHHSRGLI